MWALMINHGGIYLATIFHAFFNCAEESRMTVKSATFVLWVESGIHPQVLGMK
jgi:hypothetical protein